VPGGAWAWLLAWTSPDRLLRFFTKTSLSAYFSRRVKVFHAGVGCAKVQRKLRRFDWGVTAVALLRYHALWRDILRQITLEIELRLFASTTVTDGSLAVSSPGRAGSRPFGELSRNLEPNAPRCPKAAFAPVIGREATGRKIWTASINRRGLSGGQGARRLLPDDRNRSFPSRRAIGCGRCCARRASTMRFPRPLHQRRDRGPRVLPPA